METAPRASGAVPLAFGPARPAHKRTEISRTLPRALAFSRTLAVAALPLPSKKPMDPQWGALSFLFLDAFLRPGACIELFLSWSLGHASSFVTLAQQTGRQTGRRL